MKKVVILALALTLILPLVSCAGNKDKRDGRKETGAETETETETLPETETETVPGTVTLRSGLYFPDGANLEEELPPYIEIDTENMTWRHGLSLAMSYFNSGEITVKPVKMVVQGKDSFVQDAVWYALDNDERGIRIAICPQSDSLFIVVNVEGREDTPGLPAEGDVFILNDLSLHLTGRTYNSKEEYDIYRKSGGDLDPLDVLFSDVFCDAGDLLEICRELPVLVCGEENGRRALWDDFCEKVTRGEEAKILIAYFYRPEYGPDGPYSDSDAPLKAELHRIEYDGEMFLNSYRRSSEKFYTETDGYECLKDFDDDQNGGKIWYLCDDPDLTYDEIMKSYLSSDSNDFLHATLVYNEEEPSIGFETSPSDKTIIDLSTQVYNDEQLSEIREYEGPIEKLDEKYPVECIRELPDGAYRVSYLGEERVVSVWFDKYGDTSYSKSFGAKLSKSDFTGLNQGMSFDEVRELDPDGDYPFLYVERTLPQNISYHYTKDGYLITVYYDDALTITEVTVGLI